MVSFEDIAAAHERIKAQAKRTPVLTSATIDALTGASVFFKCENFQRMGAFKFRGAFNALVSTAAEERRSAAWSPFRRETMRRRSRSPESSSASRP